MIVRPVFPEVGPPIDLATDDARSRLDALYATPSTEWLRINLVLSVDGSAAGSDGTSASLTAGADRKVLGAIRRAADVVLVGAESVRREGYVLPKTAPLAIVTGSGELSGHALAGVEPGRLLVLCPDSARDRVTAELPAATVIVLPETEGRMAAGEIIAALRARGFGSIVCEGGPSLAGTLVDAGLVDELCLSTSPRIGGPQHPLSVAATELRLERLAVDDAGVVFARWSVARISR
ncbi:dihydrofolate reductase family protein [Lacisediminihabitans changchengi]|uniref:Dihydrofolate reductase family protein n=1 Tax=Lacisediminihabitans changchengi TaxID=2787634 RepID=A0A934VXB9_9MICO|nr:dihydrofolate reductase family protein [Lacisediminihabitans changchengi]MBK4346742.1 dihydrofolate reductase family protein [Lacisediminihabitans changchengi]MBK4348135.1 dihydrofolate reductase family protein [Lacisediminihabitans changchengi]